MLIFPANWCAAIPSHNLIKLCDYYAEVMEQVGTL